jgi:hypothetical protein
MTEDYEAPQAIRLNDEDRAYGACGPGSTAATPCSTGNAVPTGYRVNGFNGVCVTGKSASDGCYAGIG